MYKKGFITILFLSSFFILESCYTFTGSSLNPEIKSCMISNFPNYSSLQNPNLSQDFTIALQDRFTQRTKLELLNTPSDINIEGEITDYRITADNTTSNDTKAQNRLTIKVAVRYKNELEPEKSFDKTFSDYDNFDADDPQPSDQVIEDVYTRVIDQIFNAIVADW